MAEWLENATNILTNQAMRNTIRFWGDDMKLIAELIRWMVLLSLKLNFIIPVNYNKQE